MKNLEPEEVPEMPEIDFELPEPDTTACDFDVE